MISGVCLLQVMLCESQTILNESVSSLEEQFTSAELPTEYRPWLRYWWLGGAVTEHQLRREMSDISAKGFGGVSIFWTGTHPVSDNPVPGVDIVSMASEEGIKRIAMGVEIAGEAGLSVGFQPPAPLGGKLITDEFRAKDIVAEYVWVHSSFDNERMIQFTRRERPLFLALIPGKPVNRPHDIKWAICQPRDVLIPPDEPAIILDEMPDNEGKLFLKIPYPHEDYPVDNWLVAAYWVVPFTGSKASGFLRTRTSSAGTDTVDVGPIIDHYSKRALDYFMDSYIAKPAALAGPSVGKVWQNILLNSLEVYTPLWTPGLFEEFEKRRGYDLRPYLHIFLKYAPPPDVGSLRTMEEIEQLPYPAKQIVSDVEETYGELLVENHYEAFKHWTHDHGFIPKIQGHGYQTPFDWIDGHSQADVPEGESFGVPEAANAAHITGRQTISVETGYQKDYILRYMAKGGNRFDIKSFYSSPLEANWQGGRTNIHPDEWAGIRTFTDYITRSSLLLRSGRHVADVCTFGNRWRWRGSWRTDTILGPLLSRHGYLSDRFTLRSLENYAKMEDGFLLSGSGKYSVMIFNPGKAIPLEWLKAAEELIHEGLTVIAISEPVEVLTYKDHEKQNQALRQLFSELFPVTVNNQAHTVGKGNTYRITEDKLPDLLRNILKIKPQVESRLRIGCAELVNSVPRSSTSGLASTNKNKHWIEDSSEQSSEELQWSGDVSAISWQHREGKDYDLFYILNSGHEFLEGILLLRAVGRVEMWNASTGEAEPVDYENHEVSRSSVQLRLQPGEGYFLVVRSD